MPEPVSDRGSLLRPTAWSIGVVSATSAATLVLLGVVGAIATFSGSDIMLLRNVPSYVFMGLLIAVAVIAGVSMVLVALQCVREARRGYTTIANAYPSLEWRDHKTGVAFRHAGAATPRLPIRALRLQAGREPTEPTER